MTGRRESSSQFIAHKALEQIQVEYTCRGRKVEGLNSAADCVTMEQLSLNQNVQKSKEMLLKATCHIL